MQARPERERACNGWSWGLVMNSVRRCVLCMSSEGFVSFGIQWEYQQDWQVELSLGSILITMGIRRSCRKSMNICILKRQLQTKGAQRHPKTLWIVMVSDSLKYCVPHRAFSSYISSQFTVHYQYIPNLFPDSRNERFTFHKVMKLQDFPCNFPVSFFSPHWIQIIQGWICTWSGHQNSFPRLRGL